MYHCLLSNGSLGVTYEKKWLSQVETSQRLLYPMVGGTWPKAVLAFMILLLLNLPLVGVLSGLFMGWTMIKAKSLTTEAIMDALRNGCYYGSCGPVIEKVAVKGAKILVECSDAVEVHFMSKRAHGLSVYAGEGGTINEAECDLGALERYVRVEVVDGKGLRAWSNPIILV